MIMSDPSFSHVLKEIEHQDQYGNTTKHRDTFLMEKFLDNENNIHVGVDAFIIIWSNLKFWRILSFIVDLPIIKQIANLLYKKFAERRFAKLPHCQLSLDR